MTTLEQCYITGFVCCILHSFSSAFIIPSIYAT